MSEWVVWDVSYLNSFYTTVKTAIGNGTNIGIVIFGFIMTILVVIKIVKIFAKV